METVEPFGLLKPDRTVIIDLLSERDGDVCKYPGCGTPFTDERPPTIDHWKPQWWCKEQGWTFDEMWDLDNLVLMHRSCNAKKSDLVPNDDGTLPAKVPSSRILRQRARAARPTLCDTCMNGRLLMPGEDCPDGCGFECSPKVAPKVLQVKPKECDHDEHHCWMCYLGFVDRKSTLDSMIDKAVQSLVDPGDD